MAVAARHVVFQEDSLPTGFLKGREIRLAERDRVGWVVSTIQPDRRPAEAHALLEQRLVDELGLRAAPLAQPTANKVDHAVCLVGMVPGIGDRQDATARYPSHQHAGGSNIWSASKSRYRGVDIAETAPCTSERSLGLAGIALGTVRLEPFVIFSVRLAAAPALRESD